MNIPVAFSSTPESCATTGTLYGNAWAQYDTYNHIAVTNAQGAVIANRVQTSIYDGGGNVTFDGRNS